MWLVPGAPDTTLQAKYGVGSSGRGKRGWGGGQRLGSGYPALRAGRLGRISCSPALPSQLPQRLTLPDGQDFLRAVSRPVKRWGFGLAPEFPWSCFWSFHSCLRALPQEPVAVGQALLRCPGAYSPLSCQVALRQLSWQRTKKLQKSPESAGWDRPHSAAQRKLAPLALQSGCFELLA